MSLHKFYQAIDGDFEAACRRFYNENMLQKFLIRFLDEPCCAELNDALGRHDRDAAIKAVHTLAGQARSFGFIRLEKKSAALLQALRGNQDGGNHGTAIRSHDRIHPHCACNSLAGL